MRLKKSSAFTFAWGWTRFGELVIYRRAIMCYHGAHSLRDGHCVYYFVSVVSIFKQIEIITAANTILFIISTSKRAPNIMKTT